MCVDQKMNEPKLTIAEQLAELASSHQVQRTGHAPQSVTVVLSDDTLVFTLHGALTPAEQTLARTVEGASKVQEFHRQLFANSIGDMRCEIERITGRKVREASAEVETASGTVVQAFSSGAMVQIFLLKNGNGKAVAEEQFAIARAESEGLYPQSTIVLKKRPEEK
jgi:uncharacterized protein YbcI